MAFTPYVVSSQSLIRFCTYYHSKAIFHLIFFLPVANEPNKSDISMVNKSDILMANLLLCPQEVSRSLYNDAGPEPAVHAPIPLWAAFGKAKGPLQGQDKNTQWGWGILHSTEPLLSQGVQAAAFSSDGKSFAVGERRWPWAHC